MLLDRLLTALEVSVDPFAICDVRAGWRLQMPPVGSVGLHYVLRGGGELIVPGGARTAFGPRSLIVVPPGSPHRIEPDGGARSQPWIERHRQMTIGATVVPTPK